MLADATIAWFSGAMASPVLPFNTGAPQPATVELLHERLIPRLELTVYDGGVARCRQLDKTFYESFESVYGRGAVRRLAQVRGLGMTVMEADWVAADKGLLYISPHVGQAVFLPWPETWVSELPPRRFRRRTGVLVEHRTHGEMVWEMGPAAAANLRAVAAHFGRIKSA